MCRPAARVLRNRRVSLESSSKKGMKMQKRKGAGVIFDLEKLKQNDSDEIKNVAANYAKKELTNAQVGQIAY